MMDHPVDVEINKNFYFAITSFKGVYELFCNTVHVQKSLSAQTSKIWLSLTDVSDIIVGIIMSIDCAYFILMVVSFQDFII